MTYVAPHNSLSRTCGLGCSFIDGIRRTPSRQGRLVFPGTLLAIAVFRLSAATAPVERGAPLRGTAESPFPSGQGLSSRAWDRKEGVAPLLVIHPCTDLFACRRLCGVSPKSGKRKEACPWRQAGARRPLAPSRAIAECPPSAAFFFRWASPRCRARNAHLRKGQAAARRLHACAPAAGYPPPGNGASGYCFFPLPNA